MTQAVLATLGDASPPRLRAAARRRLEEQGGALFPGRFMQRPSAGLGQRRAKARGAHGVAPDDPPLRAAGRRSSQRHACWSGLTYMAPRRLLPV